MRLPRRLWRSALAVTTAAALSAVSLPPAAHASDPTYDEPYRPQFHFSLPQSWMGDPNGLVFRDGKYHLYSNGTWEGATSSDLTHWDLLPVTGPAHDTGSSTFYSGSAVVDVHNTSGFGTLENPPLVAMYTSVADGTNVQKQSLAYSLDGGKGWTRYDGNPVLDIDSRDFRDPKVFWHAASQSWRMVITLSDQHRIGIYSSPDLKTWKHESDFGPHGSTSGVWECPDLFPLLVDGDKRKQRWVMAVSTGSTGVQYFVGDFDGTTFTPDESGSYTPPPGTSIENFDAGSYDGWTATGDAFGSAPATGSLTDQQPVTGFTGSGLVNTFLRWDVSTGDLSSPAFIITKPHLNFLIGGGHHPHIEDTVPFGTLPSGTLYQDWTGDIGTEGWTSTGDFAGMTPVGGGLPNQISSKILDTWGPIGDPSRGTVTSPLFTIDKPWIDLQLAGGDHAWSQPNPTSVNVLVDGEVVATTTGPNVPDLTWRNLDLSAFQGQQAQLQIVDDNTGNTGWGHIMVGDIVFADEPAKPFDSETTVNLVVDGKVVKSSTGANSEALDWASWDLQDYVGQQAHIVISDHSKGGWGHVLADDFQLSDKPALSVDERAHWIDHGEDFYAFQSWSGTGDTAAAPRIGTAWMSSWAYAGQVPTTPFKGATSIPRKLELRTIDGKVQLTSTPVDGIRSLRQPDAVVVRRLSAAGETKQLPAHGDALEITAKLTAGNARRFGLNVRSGNGEYTQIGYDARAKKLYLDRTHSGNVGFSSSFADVHTAPLDLRNGSVTLRILVDRSSVEVFADQGQVTITDLVFPSAGSTGVTFFADGGSATLSEFKAWRLGSSWD